MTSSTDATPEDLVTHATLWAQAQVILGEFTLSQPGLTAGTVSAALMTQSGNIYTGICLDLACGIGFCAEHAAIADMLKARETAIADILAVGPHGLMTPCGRCRELMLQLDRRNRQTRVWLKRDAYGVLDALLPQHWLS